MEIEWRKAMADELNAEKSIAERATEFALTSLSINGRYHAHKERMAHAALLFQVAIFGLIMGIDKWPIPWINTITIGLHPKHITAAGVFLFWFGIHAYLRWQLRRRRSAAFFDNAVRITVTKWLNDPPTKKQLQPEPGDTERISRIWIFLDYIFPYRKAPIIYRIEKQAYPRPIFEEWENQATGKTGALLSEWIIWAGGVLMLLTILARTWLTN
jgi:hypothetical protein